MSITIVEVPTSTPDVPVPVSDSFKFGFSIDAADIATTPGSFAEVVVDFPAGCSIPSNGTTCVIWGHTFTVDDSVNATATTFKVVASGVTTATNFFNMLRANVFFLKHTSLELSGDDVTITWNACGAQDKFSGTNMDDTAIVDAGGTLSPTNGTTPIYVENYKLIARVMFVKDNSILVFAPITQFEGFLPDKNCTGAETLYIDFMPALRKELWPIMPALGPDTFVGDFGLGFARAKESMKKMGHMAWVLVEYGWQYQDSDCQPISGTFARSDEFMVMNCYFNPEDTYKLRRYWQAHPSGLAPDQSNYRLLTNQPNPMRVCADSFLWLYYIQQEAAAVLNAEFTVTYTTGGGTTYNFPLVNNGPILNFNASPTHLSTNIPASLAIIEKYSVRITATTGTAVRTESVIIVVDHNCCEESTDVYFITQLGTIGTIPVKIESRGAGQTGNEVALRERTDAGAEERAAYGGRSLFNSRSYGTMKISAREFYNPTQIKWFEQFKHSPQRWIKVSSEDGGFLARKFVVDSGEVTVYQAGEKIVLEASGYLQDIPVQSSVEPIELP